MNINKFMYVTNHSYYVALQIKKGCCMLDLSFNLLLQFIFIGKIVFFKYIFNLCE